MKRRLSIFFTLSALMAGHAIAYNPVEALTREVIHAAAQATRQNPVSGAQARPDVGSGMSITQGAKNSACEHLSVFGSPEPTDARVAQRSYFMCRLGYAGMYDPSIKAPRWIAEHLSASRLDGAAARKGILFAEDPQLPRAARASLEDYKHAYRMGYERGHLAPAGDFRASQEGMSQTFLLSNIVPQNSEHNQTIWANLEAAVRELTSRRGELFVITGPVYSGQERVVGNGLVIPSALYKVLIDRRRQEMTAFLIPNHARTGEDPSVFQVSVREVERATGLNFNPQLARPEADRAESGGGNWIMPKVRVKFKD